jgi:hypothetical protein
VFSQIDIESLQNYLLIGIRAVLAVGAAVIGWFLGPPLAALVHRAAYHKPAPVLLMWSSRLGCAALFGLLAFLLIPVGLGGLGVGSGSGGGWPWGGAGPGGNGGTNGAKGNGGTVGDGKKKPGGGNGTEQKPKETLAVEMIVSKEYEGGGKYYLIQRKGPAKTLPEVRDFLHRNKNRIGRLEIIIFANSVTRESPVVQRLQQLAEEFQVEWSVPPEYLSRIKTGNAES